ncbi:MAG: O-antigen ligase family protein [Bacteroidales bacterium]|nr:O-antigen ligase family protein [Bacteroidales bacterium]
MRQQIHRYLYLIGLLALVVGLTTSHFLMSLSWVVLGANWILEGRYKQKFAGFKSQRLLLLYLFFFAFFLIGLLWSSNLPVGLDYVRKRLPLLIVPVVILTSQPLERREYYALLGAYIITVFVASVIGLVRLATIPHLPYRDIVPFISNIRYALNLCVSACLLLWLCRRLPPERRAIAWMMRMLALYFAGYLILLQSYTGIAVLFVVATVCLIVYRKEISRPLWICAMMLIVISVVGLSATFIGLAHSYFTPSELASQPLEATTPSGNPYSHSDDSFIECGNYVNRYVCEDEIRRGWATKSAMDIDSLTPNGYSVYPTLVRYLNVTSGRKDSLSVAQLTPDDVSAIEQGIANPYYTRKFSPRRMCYSLFFEYESYRRYHAVVGFSMLQRIELWKAGWLVFLDHPLFGTGTGDYIDLCHEKLAAMDSPIEQTTWRTHVHSQYLTLLVMFGLVGFLILAGAFIYTLRTLSSSTYFPYLLIITVLLVSMLTENTLDTIGGYMMCAFFPPFFDKHHKI